MNLRQTHPQGEVRTASGQQWPLVVATMLWGWSQKRVTRYCPVYVSKKCPLPAVGIAFLLAHNASSWELSQTLMEQSKVSFLSNLWRVGNLPAVLGRLFHWGNRSFWRVKSIAWQDWAEGRLHSCGSCSLFCWAFRLCTCAFRRRD